MGTGADVAMESAGRYPSGGTFMGIVRATQTCSRSLRATHPSQNLFFASSYQYAWRAHMRRDLLYPRHGPFHLPNDCGRSDRAVSSVSVIKQRACASGELTYKGKRLFQGFK